MPRRDGSLGGNKERQIQYQDEQKVVEPKEQSKQKEKNQKHVGFYG